MFGHLLWLLLHILMSMRGEAERVPCARILFIHIPKTGVESVKATLRKSFPSFNFLDHRSYDWKSLYKREVRKGKKAPRNLIIEHHVQSEAFGRTYQNYKIFGRRKNVFIFLSWLFARARSLRSAHILTAVALVLFETNRQCQNSGTML